MSAPRGVFVVFRLPLLLLLLLGLLCGLGFAGWRIVKSAGHADPGAGIRRRMQDNISAMVSYHARFKTTPVGQDGERSYSVEIWKEIPHRFRLEMTTCEQGKQDSIEVIVGDADGVYLYDSESGEFLSAAGMVEGEIDAASLEDYWRSISESAAFQYLSEESGSRHSYYQIEIIPAEPHRFRVSERIWLEKRTLMPVRIESFDLAGCLTQVTVFEMLQLNLPLEAALFEIDPPVSEERPA